MKAETKKVVKKTKAKKVVSKTNKKSVWPIDLNKEGDVCALLMPSEVIKNCKNFEDFTKHNLILHEKYVKEVKELALIFNVKVEIKTILKS